VPDDAPVTRGRKRPRPPAMHDVARLAGVSHQTVSRVLNDHPNVRAETREKVLAAIAELGYRRNSAARALVTRRSGVLGVVMISAPEFGPTSTIIALESAAHAAGYSVSLTTLPNFSVEQVARVFEHFLALGAEGVVVVAPLSSVAETIRPFALQLPVVTIAAGQPAGLWASGVAAVWASPSVRAWSRSWAKSVPACGSARAKSA